MARKYVFTHLFDTDEEVQSVCSLLKSKYASSINNLMVEKVPYGFILQIDTKEIAEKTVEQIKAEFEPRPKPEVSKKPEPKPSPKPAEKIQAAQPVKKSPTPQSQPKPAGTAKPAKPDQKTPRPGGSRRKLIGISLSASLVLLIVILAVTGVLQNLFSGNTGETKPSDTIKQTLATSTNIPIILTQNSAADSSSNSTIKSIYVSAKPPVIDGTLSPDEWPVGFIKDFKYSYKGAEKSGMMMGCFMNDDSYLYLAITVRAEGFTPDVFDGGKTVLALDLFFDENNDGVLRKGEDNKRFWDSQYGDNHQENETAPYSTKYDTIQNGEGVRVYSNTTNTYVYECRMPLNSRDSEDLAVKAGDTIGLRAVLSEYQQTEDNKTWRTFGSYGWPGGPGWITGVYGQLVLAKKQPLAPQTPTPMPTSVQPVALRNGLVGLWSGDSNANDDLGINNGSLQGGIKFDKGMVGQAFLFDKDGQAVKIPGSSSLTIRDAITIGAWINPSSSGAISMPIVEFNVVGEGYLHILGVHIWLFPDINNLYANLVDIAGNNHYINAPGIVQTNAFQYVAVTYSQSTGIAKLYHNGKVVKQLQVGNFSLATNGEVNIGLRDASLSPRNTFCGVIDEVAIYNRALSDSEMQALYEIALEISTLMPEPTPGNWVTNPLNGHMYKYVLQAGNWQEAKTLAAKEGAHLVTINNAAEQEWIGSQFTNINDAWIGLTDESREGTFVWLTGESLSYTNWVPGEPNNQDGYENYVELVSKNCPYYSGKYIGCWNDVPFDRISNAIFEKESVNSTPTPTPTLVQTSQRSRWFPFIDNSPASSSSTESKLMVRALQNATHVYIDLNYNDLFDSGEPDVSLKAGQETSFTKLPEGKAIKLVSDNPVDAYYIYYSADYGSYDDSTFTYSACPLGIRFVVPFGKFLVIGATQNFTQVNIGGKTIVLNTGQMYQDTAIKGLVVSADKPITAMVYSNDKNTKDNSYATELLPESEFGTEFWLPKKQATRYQNIQSDNQIVYFVYADGKVEVSSLSATNIKIVTNQPAAAYCLFDIYAKDPWGGSMRHYTHAYSLPALSSMGVEYIVAGDIISTHDNNKIEIDSNYDGIFESNVTLSAGEAYNFVRSADGSTKIIGYVRSTYPISVRFIGIGNWSNIDENSWARTVYPLKK